MALEPEIADLVNDFISAGRPSSRNQTFQERRAGYVASTALAGVTETRVNVEDMMIDTIPLRIFSPLNEGKVLPAVVYYHGGCFVSGGFSTHENQLRQMAFLSGCRVVAVQYRLAPEHTYPAAHDDAEYAANTVWKHAQALGIDRVRMTQQGVKCTAQRYLGVIHGFFQLGGISQTARNLMRDICSLLRSVDER